MPLGVPLGSSTLKHPILGAVVYHNDLRHCVLPNGRTIGWHSLNEVRVCTVAAIRALPTCSGSTEGFFWPSVGRGIGSAKGVVVRELVVVLERMIWRLRVRGLVGSYGRGVLLGWLLVMVARRRLFTSSVGTEVSGVCCLRCILVVEVWVWWLVVVEISGRVVIVLLVLVIVRGVNARWRRFRVAIIVVIMRSSVGGMPFRTGGP